MKLAKIKTLNQNFFTILITLLITSQLIILFELFILKKSLDFSWSTGSWYVFLFIIIPGTILLMSSYYITSFFNKKILNNRLGLVLYTSINLLIFEPASGFFIDIYYPYIGDMPSIFLGIITQIVITSLIYLWALKLFQNSK